MPVTYISHARTPEELKEEVCSDLRRRISSLDSWSKIVARSEAEKSRLARASTELVEMLEFWTNLTIQRPTRKRK
jgi:hypothetical protein